MISVLNNKLSKDKKTGYIACHLSKGRERERERDIKEIKRDRERQKERKVKERDRKR